MSVLVWPRSPMEVVQAFEARRHGRGPISALVMWATWAVEGLHYLDDLDLTRGASLQHAASHNTNVIDIAHAQ